METIIKILSATSVASILVVLIGFVSIIMYKTAHAIPDGIYNAIDIAFDIAVYAAMLSSALLVLCMFIACIKYKYN